MRVVLRIVWLGAAAVVLSGLTFAQGTQGYASIFVNTFPEFDVFAQAFHQIRIVPPQDNLKEEAAKWRIPAPNAAFGTSADTYFVSAAAPRAVPAPGPVTPPAAPAAPPQASTPAPPSPATAPVASAVPCLGLVLPTLQMADAGSTTAAGLRDVLAAALAGPTLKAEPLDAQNTTQAAAEAKGKGCSALLVATLEQKRGGGGGLGRFAATASRAAGRYAPASGVGNVSGAVVRDVANAAADVTADLAAGTRANDEVRLDYTVLKSAGGQLLKQSAKNKASSDGQDLVTPLVRKAAEAIAAALSKSGR